MVKRGKKRLALSIESLRGQTSSRAIGTRSSS